MAFFLIMTQKKRGSFCGPRFMFHVKRCYMMPDMNGSNILPE